MVIFRDNIECAISNIHVCATFERIPAYICYLMLLCVSVLCALETRYG